tara:strand:+ start:433 stop:1152 length:720 start_codon:yes stop_codon:yes gene_type:complete
MLGLGSSICANDYPGGWDPSNLGSKLKIWLQFNTGISTVTVEEAANQITRWSDQSGNNNSALPADNEDVNEMPKLDTDGTVLFNSNTDSLVFSSALSLGKFAIYWKAKWANTISNDVPFEGNNNNFIKLASPTEIRFKADGQTREDATINEITDDGTTAVILGIERASNGDLAAYKDNAAGTFSTSAPKDGNTPIANTLDLTQVGDGTATSNWYEVVICNDVLSTSERNELYNYLTNVG